MKKLFSRPSVIVLMGVMIAGLLLIALVQANPPLALNASRTDMMLRAQSTGVILIMGIVLFGAASLMILVMSLWLRLTQQHHATTGGFTTFTPSAASRNTWTPDDTQSKPTRPATLPNRPVPMAPLAYLVSPNGQSIAIQRADFAIGRQRENDLVIKDLYVSRRHARIVMQHGHFMLCNLSKVGTFVNQAPVHEATILRGGEQIRIGSADFHFALPTQQSTSQSAVRS